MFGKKNGTVLTQKLIDGKMKISDVALDNKDSFDSALSALNQKPILAKDLNPKIASEKNLMLAWLRSSKTALNGSTIDETAKIAYFDEKKILSEENHDNDVIQTYLSLIYKNKESVKDFNIFQAFSKNLVIKLNFETQKGEEIVYQDKELNLPVYMLAKLELLLKIVDPYSFVKFIDVNVQQINTKLTLLKINPIITACLRAASLKVIGEKNICYYDFSRYYVDIEKAFHGELTKAFADAGIKVESAYIRNTTYHNNVNEIFERQKIEAMQREKELDLRHKAELMSLENYARKAEIHSKYPSYELGLTEKEKDNAIERYLTKQRGYKVETVQQVEEKVIAERDSNVGKIKTPTLVSKLFAKKSDFRKESISLVIAALFVLVGLVANMGVLGVLLIAAGIVTAGVSIAKIIRKKDLAKKANNVPQMGMSTTQDAKE